MQIDNSFSIPPIIYYYNINQAYCDDYINYIPNYSTQSQFNKWLK